LFRLAADDTHQAAPLFDGILRSSCLILKPDGRQNATVGLVEGIDRSGEVEGPGLARFAILGFELRDVCFSGQHAEESVALRWAGVDFIDKVLRLDCLERVLSPLSDVDNVLMFVGLFDFSCERFMPSGKIGRLGREATLIGEPVADK
jgi:hypothetical protein